MTEPKPDRTGSSSRAHAERLTCDITAERLAELRALADAATSGAWTIEDYSEPGSSGFRIYNEAGDCIAGNFDYEVGGVLERVDAEFIAAARAAVPELLAEVERLRGELTRFEGNAEILSASTVGEAFDRIEQTIRERDEARAELAKAREAYETHKTTADVMTLAVKRRNEEANALRARVRYVADSVAGGPDRGSLIADQIRAALDGKHARIEDAEGVARCLLCLAEWPCGNQPSPSTVEAASTVPADAVTALRDAGILACGTDQTPPCCGSHGSNCEPPSELCCEWCTETKHDTFPISHADGSRCVLDHAAPDQTRDGVREGEVAS
jgi:hypothetical protein